MPRPCSGRPASRFREEHAFTPQRYPFTLYVLDPPRAGLHLGGIQFRRHNDAKLIELMEDWWRQLKI